MDVLKKSSNNFLREVLEIAAADSREGERQYCLKQACCRCCPGRRIAVNRKPTLGGIFKSSLIELMSTINSTDVHYIRCIKPNEAKAAWKFDGPMVLSQLRACGVLETVRISCAGYPTRWTYEEFALRYYMLVRSSEWTPEIRNMATAILKKALGTGKHDGTDKYQMGLTKIFFRAGMLAFLENLRTARLNEAAIMIQKNLRAKYYRRVYLETRESIIFSPVACQRLPHSRTRRRGKTDQGCDNHSESMAWKQSPQGVPHHSQFTHQVRGHCQRLPSPQESVGHQAWKCCSHDPAQLAKTEMDPHLQEAAQRYHHSSNSVERKSGPKGLQETSCRGSRSQEHFLQVGKQGARTLTKQRNSQAAEQDSPIKDRKLRKSTQVIQRAQSDSREPAKGAAGRSKSGWYSCSQVDTDGRGVQEVADKFRRKHCQDATSARRGEATSCITEADDRRSGAVQEEEQRHRKREDIAAATAYRPARASRGAEAKWPHQRRYVEWQPPNGQHLDQPGHFKEAKTAQRSRYSRDRSFHAQYNPRPVSMAVGYGHHKTLSGSTYPVYENVEMELENILADEDMLNDEVTLGLIKNLKIPSPTSTPPPTDKEVLFPAYLINLVTSEMWNNGFVKESERFLANVMQSIQQEVMQHDSDDAINPGAFWLSNVHEMLSFVFLAEDWYEQQKTDNYEYDRLLEIVKHDLESLEFNIYHTWMKVLKKKLHKMIIPAIIESQSLPGFVTNESNRFLGKLLQGNNTPAYSMDNLLSCSTASTRP